MALGLPGWGSPAYSQPCKSIRGQVWKPLKSQHLGESLPMPGGPLGAGANQQEAQSGQQEGSCDHSLDPHSGLIKSDLYLACKHLAWNHSPNQDFKTPKSIPIRQELLGNSQNKSLLLQMPLVYLGRQPVKISSKWQRFVTVPNSGSHWLDTEKFKSTLITAFRQEAQISWKITNMWQNNLARKCP